MTALLPAGCWQWGQEITTADCTSTKEIHKLLLKPARDGVDDPIPSAGHENVVRHRQYAVVIPAMRWGPTDRAAVCLAMRRCARYCAARLRR
jgi:hypothetical protein